MTKISKNRFPLEQVTLGLVICLLVIGAGFDKPISKLVMNQNSIFGTLFQNYGLIFPSMVIFLGAQVFIYRARQAINNIYAKFAIIGLGIVACIYEVWQAVQIALFYTATSLDNLSKGLPIGAANNDGGGQLAIPTWYGPSLIILTMLVFGMGSWLCYQWLAKQDEASLARLTMIAFVGIVAVFAADTLVNSMKTLWGRFRPYEMKSDWSNYTSWLQINGNNGHKSFPSGHSQEGWIALFLPLFVAPNKVVKRRQVFIFAVVFGSLMAFSRLRVGAHFLSDVTMGSFISIVVIYASAKLLGEKLSGDLY